MNILILSEDIPFETVKRKGISAVNIQLFLIARELSELGNKVAFLSLERNEKASSGDRCADPDVIDAGKSGKFEILPPLYVASRDSSAERSKFLARLKRIVMGIFGTIPAKEFYPSIQMGGGVTRRADEFGADVLLAFVSPLAAGAMATASNYPKIIFQGNLDHITDRLRLDFDYLFAKSPASSGWLGIRPHLSRYIREKYVQRYEASHGRISLCADAVANTAACNNRFYEDIGHPRTVYVGTTWSDRPPVSVDRETEVERDGSAEHPYKIIGHVGLLNMTASTFGLAYLLQEVMPALRREMQDHRFEVHVIGDGAPVEPLRPYLTQENLHVRGYVEDLDSELHDCDVFLFLNNAGPLKAIFSRQIMSWAMGLCLIAHAGSREALPELAHGDNALIGTTPDELAELVAQACLDGDLNRKLRQGGRATYENNFSPTALSKKLVSIMEEVIS